MGGVSENRSFRRIIEGGLRFAAFLCALQLTGDNGLGCTSFMDLRCWRLCLQAEVASSSLSAIRAAGFPWRVQRFFGFRALR
jgi:hypothetical protein